MKYIQLLLLIFPFLLSSQSLDILLITSDIYGPTDIQNAGDDRIFVVEEEGKIKILNQDGTINTIPFLDISNKVTSGGEQGMLGLAFHPNYSDNGYFFVNYIDLNGNTQVSRFSVDESNPDIADPSSELFIIDYNQPFPEHNGGSLAFDSLGYLYISSGDGGNAGDPGNRAQNLNLLLGKILRIDIENSNLKERYAIPEDNPFVNNPNALDEIWVYGLRNPWRMSIDTNTDTIWLGDVGQSSVEEVNKISNTQGGANFGWRCYEGTQPFNKSNCSEQLGLIFPIYEYEHINENCSITGGYLYRGTNLSTYQDQYFFTDFCSGIISSFDESTGITTEHETSITGFATFGVDFNQELYIANHFNGDIYKIIDAPLSVEETNYRNVKIIPNPASDKIQILSKNEVIDSILVYDTTGKLILSRHNIQSNENLIHIKNFEKGIYFITILFNNGNKQYKKLIIN